MSKYFICKGCGEKLPNNMMSINTNYCHICNDYFTKFHIAKLESQIKELEKALELACEKLPMEYEYCSSHPEKYNLQDEYGCDDPYWVEEGGCEFDSPERCLECVIKYFKNKAKEM